MPTNGRFTDVTLQGRAAAEGMDLTIRAERPSDIPAIRSVTRSAFEASPFGYHGEAELVERLRSECRPFISLVAERGAEIVGQLLFTPVTLLSDQGSQTGMGLGPVAVSPGVQRGGVGTALVSAGLDHLRAEGWPFVVVLGDPEFYGRLGFTPASQLGVRCEFTGIPKDAFQILAFATHSPLSPGVVRYHPAFSETAAAP